MKMNLQMKKDEREEESGRLSCTVIKIGSAERESLLRLSSSRFSLSGF